MVRSRWRAVSLLVVAGCWSAAAPALQAANDEVASDSESSAVDAADGNPGSAPGRDPLTAVLGILAENLGLGWKGDRLEIDVHALQSALCGEDFIREREAVHATVERIQKLVIDEAVANGLARDKAEELFGTVRARIAPSDGEHRWLFREHGDQAGLSQYFEEITAARLLEKSFERTLITAGRLKLLDPGGGGSGSSQSRDMREWHMSRAPFHVHCHSTPGFAECTLKCLGAKHEIHWLKIGFAGEAGLTVSWQGDGDVHESVRLVQTENQFRVRHVREEEILIKLEGESFRDCCRVNPDVVRRDLKPLLKRVGVRLPPMPDDEAVKVEVVARLRKAAGTAQLGGAEEISPGVLAARKRRAVQLSATIDAFGLLDDRRYLEDLKQTAAPDDSRAIEERLAALQAGP
jgi:hypothetical protein